MADFSLNARIAEVSARDRNAVSVYLLGVDLDSVLDQIDIDDVIHHFGTRDLLDVIGETEAASHFGLARED